MEKILKIFPGEGKTEYEFCSFERLTWELINKLVGGGVERMSVTEDIDLWFDPMTSCCDEFPAIGVGTSRYSYAQHGIHVFTAKDSVGNIKGLHEDHINKIRQRIGKKVVRREGQLIPYIWLDK
ncbi:hypothetical protein [Shouchella lonarensis]|uniref:Uncharacterized protein n=1 Tax=Shouchella lonarensis TaxID=1464122 RepID=A0A1G6HMA5_9BACI|nr:hypothetical protein [Shouchella lonarensis]SDB95390.1 hypothetical protein SAMN05421737_10476 [Shouchella lonarensis]